MTIFCHKHYNAKFKILEVENITNLFNLNFKLYGLKMVVRNNLERYPLIKYFQEKQIRNEQLNSIFQMMKEQGSKFGINDKKGFLACKRP